MNVCMNKSGRVCLVVRAVECAWMYGCIAVNAIPQSNASLNPSILQRSIPSLNPSMLFLNPILFLAFIHPPQSHSCLQTSPLNQALHQGRGTAPPGCLAQETSHKTSRGPKRSRAPSRHGEEGGFGGGNLDAMVGEVAKGVGKVVRVVQARR